jgi:hypothetical protein
VPTVVSPRIRERDTPGRTDARCTPLGADVAGLLPQLILSKRRDLTVGELVRNVHRRPTLPETLQGNVS